MAKIKITGLVKLANLVRGDLSRPISVERLESLRNNVANAIAMVRGVLKKHGAGASSLPTPSRRAYEFILALNFDTIDTREADSSDCRASSSSTFRGLQRSLRMVVAELAEGPEPEACERTLATINRLTDKIESQMRDFEIPPHELTAPSLAARGWMAYFADREHFSDYLRAVRLAREVFEPVAGMPVSVQFRPIKVLYRTCTVAGRRQINLPSAMVCFDGDAFAALAAMAFGGGRTRQAVTHAMLTEAYQQVQTELELLGGVIDRTAGVYHDLSASFERVRRQYFPEMDRPRLTWSESFTSRKFGHYEQTHDTVMVNSTLDHPRVPVLAVDFVMYHELLHREIGIGWRNGRQVAHTPQFARREKQFDHYDEAVAMIGKLASGRK